MLGSNDQVERLFPGAYCLTPEDLNLVEDLLKRELRSKLRWVLHVGQIRRTEYDSVSDLLADSFIHSSGITQISVECQGESARVAVEFRTSFFRPVWFKIVGDRSAVLGLEAQIASVLQSPRRWYSLMVAPFGQHITMGLFIHFCALIAVGVFAYAVAVEMRGGDVRSEIWLSIWLVLLTALVWISIPTMTFAIGRGRKRAAALQGILSWAFLGAGTATLVNWITAIWNPFQR